ncbi:MAG: HAD family hydrolase [Acutalibacteraceae bacterium]|nr:HAD family hydrolase [Acutalibacteraceae bacterium]
MIKLVVFDLDGTIYNTIEDLADSTNVALLSYGYPTHSIETYKYFVGNGIPNLIMRALPEEHKTQEECDQARGRMLDYYKDHYADKSVPYDGVMDMLKTLKDRGIRLAVCTNKAHHMAVKIAENIFGGIFDKVIGQSTDRPLKPDPFSVFEIMELVGAAPEETVFVGDSGVDMQVANNAGIKGIGVLWGFRTEKELKENGGHYIVAAPSEIIEIINKL